MMSYCKGKICEIWVEVNIAGNNLDIGAERESGKFVSENLTYLDTIT